MIDAKELGKIDGKLEIVIGNQMSYHEESQQQIGQLFEIVNKINSHGCGLAPSHHDQEKRIRNLEATQSKAIGIVAGIAAMVGMVGSFIAQWIKGLIEKG